MILKSSFPLCQILFQIAIPVLLYSFICCIETTFPQISLLLDASLVKDFLLGFYSNYPLFMIAMLLFKYGIRRPGETPQTSKNQSIFFQFLGNCLCFTLIYACFQVLPLAEHHKSDKDLSILNNGVKEFPRLLEEKKEAYLIKDPFFLPEEEESSISNMEFFEVGKIIGSRDSEEAAGAMVISKDGKTMFVIGQEKGALQIFDISNNQNFKLLSALPLAKGHSLLLSADEKLLYSSGDNHLEIIDVSNLRSPSSLSYIEDAGLIKAKKYLYALLFYRHFYKSMALSWDNKTLYAGGDVFQIFSVENPREPRLIFSSAQYEMNLYRTFETTVATSADGRMLYVANRTIQVFNISLNSSNPVLESTFKGAHSLYSLLPGKDNKTLYALGKTSSLKTVFQKFLIEENSVLKNIETFELEQLYFDKNTSRPSIIATSLSENTLFFFYYSTGLALEKTLRGINLQSREILDPYMLLPEESTALHMIPNTNNYVFSERKQLNTISFLFNYPNPQSFGLSNNTLGYYRANDSVVLATPSSLGIDRLYTINEATDRYVYWRDDESKTLFTIVDMTNKKKPKTLATYFLKDTASSLQISERANRAFVFDDEHKIQILDFSNFSSIEKLGEFDLESYDTKFIVFDDGKTVLTYFTDEESQATSLKVLDFSDPSSIKLVSEGKIEKDFERAEVRVSNQGIMFLCRKNESLVYNISSSFRLIASIPFPSADQELVKCTLFEEKGLFFLQTDNQDTFNHLSIFNISDIKSPELITAFLLPKLGRAWRLEACLVISPDASKGYMLNADKLLVIDFSNPRSPMIKGQIPLGESMRLATKLFISGDNKAAYLLTSDYYNSQRYEVIMMIDLQMKYTFYLSNNIFALGKKYAAESMLLKLNEKSHYEKFADSQYKILKVSLSQISLKGDKYLPQTTYAPLPDWMTFDKENGLFHIESKRERDIGNYTLYSACSLKVPLEAFRGIFNSSETEDLVSWLISLGFLDNQRFLTPSFRNEKDFIVHKQFTRKKYEIYNILKEYYFETFTPLIVRPSLNLKVVDTNSEKQYLSVKTPSGDVIKVDIKFTGKKNPPQFLSKAYGSLIPSITEYKTHFRIEGRLDEVNAALERLVVNNKSLVSDGEIIVNDNMNQPLEMTVKNIVKYFVGNKPPRMILDVQSQIDVVPIYTGEFMMIPLDHSTFLDENLENLNYKLVMNTKERLEKPAWLGFDSNNLVLKGTAPEQFFNREIKLLLIAENEFEKIEVPFRLEIKLSSVYFLKLLVRFSPYILTIIGLYIKANKIYNIVFVRWFKHPKEFVLEIGKEIDIPPVWFIAEEKKESEMILEKLRNKIAKDLGCSASSREEIIDHFWNFESGELYAEKLRRGIEETVYEIEEEKNKPRLFLSETKSRAPLICQLIENQFVLWKLDSKQEKSTKKMFNKMKKLWVNLVKWDNLSSQFIIRQDKFEGILEVLGGRVSEKFDQTTDSESLLSKEESEIINTALLKQALRILAFQNHCLNKKPIVAYIKVRQRSKANCLKRLLRRDLVEVSFSENRKKVYGIKYKIDKGRLEFSGVPDQELEGEVLVVQVTNSHERVLKEIWIHGVPGEREKSFMIHNKSGYEVF